MPKHARVLSSNEFELLLNYVQTMRNSGRNRLVLHLTHYAGMRVGEVSGLLAGDLVGELPAIGNGRANEPYDFIAGNRLYSVVEQIQLRKRQTKGKSARSVHLSHKVKEEIKNYFCTFDVLHLGEHFCVSAKGTAITNVTLSQEMWKWYKRCGLFGASSHSGRRGYVTGLLNNGVNIKVVQNLVGHRYLTTTQVYADTDDMQLKDAVERL